MPPRASWKGNLKISLVSIPVRLYNATTQSNRITLNQVHKDCNLRLKFPATCPVHGVVERDQITKAYEYEQDKYVLIDQSDIDKIKLESNKTIEVNQFVDAGEVDPLYMDTAYYVAPDGPIAEEPFAVVRHAIEKAGKVGLGRVTMLGRERALAISPESKGFRMIMLRAADEVRPAAPCFDDVADRTMNPDQVSLATRLIESMEAKFDAAAFTDRYQEQLLALIKAKIAGQEPVFVQEEEVGRSFSFMDALKASLGAPNGAAAKEKKPAAGARKPAAKSVAASEKVQKKRKQA